MKKRLLKKSVWQSILSAMALVIFAYFAIGSLSGTKQQTRHLGNGVYETAKFFSDESSEVITGKHDEYGRWHGEISIVTEEGFLAVFTEKVTMVNGKRHGQSITTFSNGYTSVCCYNMGEKVDCEKSAKSAANDSTAFQITKYKHPWFINTLNMLGFSNGYIESYIDTVEMILNSKEFEIKDFHDNYDDVIEVLEETPYDSLIENNYLIIFYLAMENMKNAEFRLATIDHLSAENTGTYKILQTTYPGYVLGLNKNEITDGDLEAFCQEFDDILESYGPLDLEDPFFVDSADSRMYRAIDSIWTTDKSASIITTLKSAVVNGNLKNYLNFTNPDIKTLIVEKTPQEVATTVMISIYWYYVYCDLIRYAVWDAYVLNNGIIEQPTLTTVLSENNSPTSVTVVGNIIKDGGNNITDKGIVWGTYFNPTIDDNVETRGNGTLPFSATIEGLTGGETYFARAFATNSAGTAYGNCISFTAGNTVGIDDNKFTGSDFAIYPNPAASVVTFSFQWENTENLIATIVDLNGKVIVRKELNNIQPGVNEVQMDLSGVKNGIYNCRITNNKSIKMNRKLVVAH